MVYEIEKLIDYILNNNLNIDKSLFFTIVIGQISIYGILLTFYQFVASFQGNRKAVVTYLGTSLNEYFVKQTVSSFNKIVSKKWFGLLFVLEHMCTRADSGRYGQCSCFFRSMETSRTQNHRTSVGCA